VSLLRTHLLLLLLLLPANAPGAGRQLVAIWGLRTPGVAPGAARRLRAELARGVSALPGFRLVGEKTLQTRLRRRGVLPGASWQQVRKLLGVKYVLSGTLAGLAGELTLDLRLQDTASGAVVRQTTVALPANNPALRNTVREVLVRLLLPERWVGALDLRISEQGARVYLDGKLLATSPLDKPLTGLVPGKHILRITKEGYDEFSRFVEVRYGQTARLDIDLKNAMVVGLLYEREKPKPPPPPPPANPPPRARKAPPAPGSRALPAVGWSLLGGGAAVAGAGAGLAFAGGKKTAGMVMIAAGATLVVGGVLALLLAPGSDTTGENGREVSLWLSAGGGSGLVGLRGSF